MTMPTERLHGDLLTLAQWVSPAYPLGSFSWSHGLETAVADGQVGDRESLRDWIADVLDAGSGRSDAIWMRLAHGALPEELARLNDEARAFQPSRERLAEAERQGAAFCRTTRAVWKIDLPDLLLPLAIGAGARRLSLDIDATVALALQAFAGNLVAIAQRLTPLGQTEAQAVLASLAPLIVAVGAETRDAGLDDLFSNAFASDIAAMRHETQDVRLFQS